ncbi:MAG: malonyl-CoA decarboxylase [Rhodospirillales bacterium]|nr:malonyl-CoA decarboxylase [Rhodospirillales bacterium]
MNVHPNSSFLDRTLNNLKSGWQAIAGASYDATVASDRPDLPEGDQQRIRQQMLDCLGSKGGEVSARARAAALGHVYLALDMTGRERFLRLLASEFGINQKQVDEAIAAVADSDSPSARSKSEENLRRALVAPRVKLLTQFNALPEGVKFLVDMRADLLSLLAKAPELKGLDNDLRNLLESWFDVGFLELRLITWDASPAALLEKLIAYEAVHAIQSWDDLKNRLDSDRRCFAYFHPNMPNEPLIFVEVALVNGIAGNVQKLLDGNAPVIDPDHADTAIFYSISNAQKGLAGISFGNFLIKGVVAELASEFKNLKIFSTLSPIPGFRKWLDEVLAAGQANLLKPAERRALNLATGRTGGAKGSLKKALEDDAWCRDENLCHALQAPLQRLAAEYLMKTKIKDGRARDPVAHFHLSNGAIMERLNWMGDNSANGIRQSCGMMINYLYNLDRIEDNHEAYSGGRRIKASSSLKNILNG